MIVAALIGAISASATGHMRISLSEDLRVPVTVTKTTTVTTTVTRAPGDAGIDVAGDVTLLSDLEALEYDPYTGPITINGHNYADSIYDYVDSCGDELIFEYEIARKYSRFTATVGLGSKSESGAVVQFRVFVDGKEAADPIELGVGQDDQIDVPVEGGFILRVEVTEVQGDLGGCSADAVVGWASPALKP